MCGKFLWLSLVMTVEYTGSGENKSWFFRAAAAVQAPPTLKTIASTQIHVKKHLKNRVF